MKDRDDEAHGYDRTQHGAAWTAEYIFHQLIPYLGNKRKLLNLIGRAVAAAELSPGATFLDLFAGSGVVSRWAKQAGFRVLCNDWEPYAEAINRCAIGCDAAPIIRGDSYADTIAALNRLPPRAGWVTQHLCPLDDAQIDSARDRLFFMRKNGLRIDAIREQIQTWQQAGDLDADGAACLLAPLLYATCYASNTSGVFKGFHNGWGGQTGTALYRIAGDLFLRPAVFYDNGYDNIVFKEDATALAADLASDAVDFAYLDPPYNQHSYGANYHVLNTVTLWDAPPLSPRISGRDKAAIRTDWRTDRRSHYNYRKAAAQEYARLVGTLNARFIATSYSTDGTIPLPELVRANLERGRVRVLSRGYKRYRVSSQRFSKKPMNVEFVILTETQASTTQSVEEIVAAILETEQTVLQEHGAAARASNADAYRSD